MDGTVSGSGRVPGGPGRDGGNGGGTGEEEGEGRSETRSVCPEEEQGDSVVRVRAESRCGKLREGGLWVYRGREWRTLNTESTVKSLSLRREPVDQRYVGDQSEGMIFLPKN